MLLVAVKVLLYIRAYILSDLDRKLLSDSVFGENRHRECSTIPLSSVKFNLHVLRDGWYVGSKERLIKFTAHRLQSYTFREINMHSVNGSYSCRIFYPMSVFKHSLTFRFEVLIAVGLTMKTAVALNVRPCSMVGVYRRFGTPAAWIIHHHHHHVQEGLGLISVPCILKMKLSLHLFLGRPMCIRPFGLYCSACLGILFVSILCMCCSHFSWYCFISFIIFSAPVFSLIHCFFFFI